MFQFLQRGDVVYNDPHKEGHLQDQQSHDSCFPGCTGQQLFCLTIELSSGEIGETANTQSHVRLIQCRHFAKSRREQ